ncbi:MAG TPA: hypothetical protein VKW06_00485 [Candidatus Angelobacter sp.]|nr:hypothetical protein [Candidatus Angelobacter sp.]
MPAGIGGGVIIVLLGLAGAYYGGKAAYKHVVKPVDHAVCRAVTFGHKCKPSPKHPAAAQTETK